MCLSTITSSNIEKNYARRFLFGGDHRTSTLPTSSVDEPSMSHMFSSWLTDLLLPDSNKDSSSSLSSKLMLLKTLLSKASSSSSDKNGKLDQLFQLLTHTSDDKKNQASTSSSKLNHLLSLLANNSSTSNNLQLATKLLSLAQGNASLSSLSASDMKSLVKFVSG
jgi:hypothetical protein